MFSLTPLFSLSPSSPSINALFSCYPTPTSPSVFSLSSLCLPPRLPLLTCASIHASPLLSHRLLPPFTPWTHPLPPLEGEAVSSNPQRPGRTRAQRPSRWRSTIMRANTELRRKRLVQWETCIRNFGNPKQAGEAVSNKAGANPSSKQAPLPTKPVLAGAHAGSQ